MSERAFNVCGCFSGASKVSYKRYNSLVQYLLDSSVVAEVSADPETPLSKVATSRLDKVEDYAARSPHRVGKLARRFRRQSEGGLAKGPAGLKEVRLSLEGFLRLLQARPEDEALVAFELNPVLRSLLASSDSLRNALGCSILARYLHMSEDLSLVHETDAMVPRVAEIAIASHGKGQAAFCAVAALREVVGVCKRTGHLPDAPTTEALARALLESVMSLSQMPISTGSGSVTAADSTEDGVVPSEEASLSDAERGLQEILVVSSDSATARFIVSPMFAWLDGDGSAPRWQNERSAVILRMISDSFISAGQTYILLQMLLQHIGGSETLQLAALKMAEGLFERLEDELIMAALLLMLKELPVHFDGEDDSPVLCTLQHCVALMGNHLHILQVMAGVLGRSLEMGRAEGNYASTLPPLRLLVKLANSAAEMPTEQKQLLTYPLSLSDEVVHALLKLTGPGATSACQLLTGTLHVAAAGAEMTDGILREAQLWSMCSALWHALPRLLQSPAFIVAADRAYKAMLASATPAVALPFALPFALALQGLALHGWGGDNTGQPKSLATEELRLLMLSFSMLRHIGKAYACRGLPMAAHPTAVSGLVDSAEGIALSDGSADEQELSEEESAVILEAFSNEYSAKGGAEAARKSVTSSLLNVGKVSASLSLSAREALMKDFAPIKEKNLFARAQSIKLSSSSTVREYTALPSVSEVVEEVQQIAPSKVKSESNDLLSPEERRNTVQQALSIVKDIKVPEMETNTMSIFASMPSPPSLSVTVS